MKPAREWLLRRHAAAEPRLDELRRDFVAGLRRDAPARSANGAPPESGWRLVWQEVFVRARTAWSGLAVAGLVALALHASVPRSRVGPASPATPAALVEVREERARLLAELFGSPGSGTPAPAPAPAPAFPAAPAGSRRSSLDPSHPGVLPA